MLMDFELSKPPIVEGWIRALFESPQDGLEWDWDCVVDFLGCFADELPVRERMQVPEPIVDHLPEGEVPTEIQIRVVPKYFRARTVSRSRVVQVGENELLVSQLRDENGCYPGFTPLLNHFMAVLTQFREHVNLGVLNGLELHYVDIIRIPVVDEDVIDLRDFFDGAPEVPKDPFGGSFRTDWSMSFITPDCDDISEFSAQLKPVRDRILDVRLDWHRRCRNLPDNPESIASRLRMAHTYLKNCFRHVCKPPVWHTFQPK